MMSRDSDDDLLPCISERLNKLIDFTPAVRDSENLRAKCKKFWEEMASTPGIEDILVNQKDKDENLCCPTSAENKRPFLTKLMELKRLGIDKVALAADDGCKYCQKELKECEFDESTFNTTYPTCECNELPIECRSDLFIVDPYRVDRLITEPRVFKPNMYEDQWKIRQEEKKN